MAIIRAGIDVGLQIGWQHHVHAAIAGSDTPPAGKFGPWLDPRVNTSVAGLDIESVHAPVNLDVPISRVRINATIEVTSLNMTVASVQPDVTFGALHGNAAVPSIDIHATFNCLHADRAVT